MPRMADDVLQVLVALQHPLHVAGDAVVLLADHLGVEDARVGGQRVDGRIERLVGQGAFQRDDGVQVAEGGHHAGVGVVVGRHVDGLEGGDGTLAGGGDALLKLAHLGGQRGLVTHGRGHAPQQGRDLHAGQGVAVDVIDEEQHVLVLDIAEVLGHGEAGKGDAQTHGGQLVHLAEYQRRLAR